MSFILFHVPEMTLVTGFESTVFRLYSRCLLLDTMPLQRARKVVNKLLQSACLRRLKQNALSAVNIKMQFSEKNIYYKIDSVR